jgi:hypothetical protein
MSGTRDLPNPCSAGSEGRSLRARKVATEAAMPHWVSDRSLLVSQPFWKLSFSRNAVVGVLLLDCDKPTGAGKLLQG